MVSEHDDTDDGAHRPSPGVFPPPATSSPSRADREPSVADTPTVEQPVIVVADDQRATELPRGAFPAPGAADALRRRPFDDPGSSTPAPPPSVPMLQAPADQTTAPELDAPPRPGAMSSMPGGSPFAAPGSSTPAPPAPLPRDPWARPSYGAPPTPPPMSGPPMSAPPMSAPPRSPFAPPGEPGMPSAPPQYDPNQYGGPFGAAGAVPPGLVPPLPGRSSATPSTPPQGTTRTAVLVGVLSAIIASLITGGLFVAFGRSTTGVDAGTSTTSQPGPTYLNNSLDIHGLLDRAQPSVVTIRTDTSSVNGKQPLAAGSGVIISADGLVLTNAHVIAGATGLKVILFDGTSKTATLVGSLPNDDVALIRIQDPGTLTPAELGTASDLKVGDPVVAIGNALNLGGSPSVTEGIVSAKDRDIQTSEGNLTNLIQTDAAINPGNSGGPLVNASGQVVGINTAIIENSQNIGFAISIDVIKPRIEDLKNGKGTVTPDSAFLGVSTQSVKDVSAAILQKYGVTASDGAFVSDVVVGSSAEEAGLQPGDVITSIDGKTIVSAADVGSAIRTKKAGDTVEMTFEREGESQTVTVTLKSRATTGK